MIYANGLLQSMSRMLLTWDAFQVKSSHLKVARNLLEQSVALCRRLGPSSNKYLALALNFLGWENRTRGNLTTSQANLEESLTIRRELDDSWGIAQSLMNLGFTASRREDFAEAQEFFEKGLLAARALGERSYVASLLNGLGWIVAHQGDLKHARSLVCESLEICRELKWVWRAADAFENLAIIEAWQADADQLKKAARYWGIAEMLYKVWGSMYRLEDSETQITSAREQLGEDAFSAAWLEGGKMSFDQAVAYAFESSADAQRNTDG
jgi:tetratricopeptide (TPR) repeat protein